MDDPITGDGAGIFIQMPDKFLSKVVKEDLSIDLPPFGDYGVGFVYLSKKTLIGMREKSVVEEVLLEEGLELITWREVPVNSSILGKASAACEPKMEQVFVKRPEACERGLEFERKLYLARRIITFRLALTALPAPTFRSREFLFRKEYDFTRGCSRPSNCLNIFLI